MVTAGYTLKLFGKAYSSASGNELMMVVRWKWYKTPMRVQ